MVRGRSDMDSILFISPVFFDYYKAIIEEFTKLDYKVSWYGDRPSESFLSKIIIRLFPKLAVRKVDRYINKIISENSTVSFQYVVVIDGQCFQPKHIKKLKEKFSDARFIYYLWDSTTQFGFIEKLAPYFDKVFSFSNLYNAFKQCKKGVAWKTSTKRYKLNVLRNTYDTYSKLKNLTYRSKGFFEFDIIERGKPRHIRSVHISERVVQRTLCDECLVPMLERSIIYDNSASVKGKGIDFAINRLEKQLHRHYRKYGNDGYVL